MEYGAKPTSLEEQTSKVCDAMKDETKNIAIHEPRKNPNTAEVKAQRRK